MSESSFNPEANKPIPVEGQKKPQLKDFFKPKDHAPAPKHYFEETDAQEERASPSQELLANLGQRLYLQEKRINGAISKSALRKRLLEEPEDNIYQFTAEDGTDNVQVREAGVFVVTGNEEYSFTFETPAIVNAYSSRYENGIDGDTSMTAITFEHLGKAGELEDQLGIAVGSEGLNVIKVHAFKEDRLDEYIKGNVDVDPEFSLDEVGTKYYISESGSITKAINTPYSDYDDEQLSDDEAIRRGDPYDPDPKLINAGLNVVSAGRMHYVVSNEIHPEEYEMLGLALSLTERRVMEKFTAPNTNSSDQAIQDQT